MRMTQDADTPRPPAETQTITSEDVGSLNSLFAPQPPTTDEFVEPGASLFSDPSLKAPVTADGEVQAEFGDGFYEKLDYLEAEGKALLQTAETKVEAAGHTI